MFKFTRKIAVAALVALTAAPLTAGVASAQEGFFHDGGVYVQYGGGWEGGPRHHRGCHPRMAEEIARDYGMRRPRVTDITPRRVFVEGRNRGRWDRMVFANVRGCPLLRR